MMILLPLKGVLPILSGKWSLLVFVGVTLLVFAVSTGVAFALDKVVIDPAKNLFDKAFKRFLRDQSTESA